MKIIFDIPDNSKCLSITVVFGDGSALEMATATIATKGLYNGRTIQIPSEEKAGEKE